jgi:hypothetical protein
MTKWRRVACWITKATRAQAHARACVPSHIHVRMHTREPLLPPTHTHTEICNNYVFPRRQLFREHPAMLTLYVACLVQSDAA